MRGVGGGTGSGMPAAVDARRELAEVADPVDAANLARFFQTGPGGYGEGDVFIGVRVPAIRAVVRRVRALPLSEIDLLLDDPQHEHRLLALLVMVDRFRRASRPGSRDEAERARLHLAYVAALRRGRVDNWDLVDSSAEWLIGEALRDPFAGADGMLVAGLLADPDLWRRRAGILATFAWTKAGQGGPALDAAAAVIGDRRDLIQKAAGWMLREVGKRVDRALLLAFLDEHAATMPRTMLSYAIEHLQPEVRAAYRAARGVQA